MQRMNGVPYSSHPKARQDDPQARPGWKAEAVCLLPTELGWVSLVSCQYEFAGWEPSVWDYHGTGNGLWVCIAPRREFS